jgi:hypothetical protein
MKSQKKRLLELLKDVQAQQRYTRKKGGPEAGAALRKLPDQALDIEARIFRPDRGGAADDAPEAEQTSAPAPPEGYVDAAR